MSINAAVLQRYYDASYPPSILGGGGGGAGAGWPAGSHSPFGSTLPEVPDQNMQSGTYAYGMKYTALVAGTIEAVGWWRHSAETHTSRTIHVWKDSDQSLLNTTAITGAAVTNGWQVAPLLAPVALAAGEKFTVTMDLDATTAFAYYGATTSVTPTSAIPAEVSIDNNAYGSPATYPGDGFGGAYFVDLSFKPAATRSASSRRRSSNKKAEAMTPAPEPPAPEPAPEPEPESSPDQAPETPEPDAG